jgi:hypothetical protein
MTLGYADVTWETVVRAVEVLEQLVLSAQIVFGLDSGKIPGNSFLAQKAV